MGRYAVLLMVLAAGTAQAAGMEADPDARALLEAFKALSVAGPALADDFNNPAERRLTGPVTVKDGALQFPDGREEAVHVQYGVVLPRRGRLALDFRLDQMPKDHNFMTLCDTGTAGNTKFTLRLGLDRKIRLHVLTRRENLDLQSEPVPLGQWNTVEWFYGPEGSVLRVNGVIEDYSTDYSVPYSVETGDAFYLGDQPWWDAGGRRGIFYPHDSFVGQLDNLRLEKLQK